MLQNLIVWTVVFAIVVSLLYYVINALVPEPAKRFFLILLYVLAALIVISALLSLAHGGPVFHLGR
jgi:hypothetical protein